MIDVSPVTRRLLVVGSLLAIGVLGVVIESDPGWRHAYAAPVLAAALGSGVAGGSLAAIAALMAQAPAIVAGVEAFGLAPDAVEQLVSAATLLVLGPVLGSRVSEARRQRARYVTVVEVENTLREDRPLFDSLVRLREQLAERLQARVTLAVRDGDHWLVAGSSPPNPASIGARAMATASAIFIPDAGGRRRPHRVLSVPLVLRGETIGVLTIEREGEMPAAERQANGALALHVAAALENARLTAQQRRFAAELAEKVQSATERLQSVDRAKSAFVAMASHELRTPLTSLVGFSELLATRTFGPEEVRRQATVMRRQTLRLARIIDDFLDLSRLERGEPPQLQIEAVDIAAALTAAADLFATPQRPHRIVVDCAPDLPLVRADPQALERMVANLISNALKYSPPATTVTVRARTVDKAVSIAIEDHGRGIAPEALPRIFEPYFRAPDAVGRAPGSGLGLAMVKSLVDAHDGRIQVESRAGIGTRVTLELPCVP